MALTQYFVAASVDGFIADADGKLDWLFQFNDVPGFAEQYQAFLSGVGAIAMGAATYEFVRKEVKETWPYAGLPTWVFTHRNLAAVPGADLRFTSAPVEQVHRELLEGAQGKNVWLVGGGGLVGQFAERGLLDELHLCVIPVVLGSGAPLLTARLTKPMELLKVTQFPRGAVELRYRIT